MKKLKNKSVQSPISLDEPAPWPRSQQYLPHTLMCEDLIKQWDITLDEASTLLNNAGVYLLARGQYQEAAPLSEYALSIQEKMYGHDHPSTNFLKWDRKQKGWIKYELSQNNLILTKRSVGTLSGGQVTDLSCAPPIYRPTGLDSLYSG